MAERIPYGAWPRMLKTEQAAAYVGDGRTKFLAEVEAGVWPEPEVRGGRKFWDRVLLDQAQDARSGLASEPGEEKALRAIHEHRAAEIRPEEA